MAAQMVSRISTEKAGALFVRQQTAHHARCCCAARGLQRRLQDPSPNLKQSCCWCRCCMAQPECSIADMLQLCWHRSYQELPLAHEALERVLEEARNPALAAAAVACISCRLRRLHAIASTPVCQLGQLIVLINAEHGVVEDLPLRLRLLHTPL